MSYIALTGPCDDDSEDYGYDENEGYYNEDMKQMKTANPIEKNESIDLLLKRSLQRKNDCEFMFSSSIIKSKLKAATKNFNSTTRIGKGGFGYVYKATVKSGEGSVKKIDVAVKRLGSKRSRVTTFFFKLE
ncbi:hypothetical protein RND71_028796 [Anisodus tanguticus]|uniref:Protein kinase domain-containing protein n=1 Tax=Anisodus tanguticus TaxID=243964 RepID=A0AAE1RKB4_9SOLA|nr:hypothetical protein RND71_028796 [Anisodus tanguticus]